MALENLNIEVRLRLIETAWDAAKTAGIGADRGSGAIKNLVDHFDQALDGMVAAYESAEKKGDSKEHSAP